MTSYVDAPELWRYCPARYESVCDGKRSAAGLTKEEQSRAFQECITNWKVGNELTNEEQSRAFQECITNWKVGNELGNEEQSRAFQECVTNWKVGNELRVR
ncbi:MAG: hypothetical protein HUU46_14300 [Candidatus Hydrogenedentes bacterium]|nr:hypothetical protein [Candidatus Hydrogenedentota bacterium]